MTNRRQPTKESNSQIEALLNEVQYSRITGRSVGSARYDRALGIGCPYVKLGNSVRYRPADVRAYIEKNVRLSTAC